MTLLSLGPVPTARPADSEAPTLPVLRLCGHWDRLATPLAVG